MWSLAALAVFLVAMALLYLRVDDPNDVVFLYTVPVIIVAVQRGVRAGMLAAAGALALYLAWVLLDGAELDLVAIVSRAAAFLVLALVIGYLSQQLSLAARHNEVLLNTMLDPFAVWVAVRDRDGTITDFRCEYANEAARVWAGGQGEQLVGRSMAEVFPSTVEDGALASYRRLVETGEPLASEQRVAGRVLDVRAVQLGDGFAAAARDATDRKIAEEWLMSTRAELERSNDALKEFAEVASHELSEPLATAGLYAETLSHRARATLDPPSARLIELLRQTLDRMQDRVRGLLSYAEVRYGAEPRGPVDCDALLVDVLSEMASSIADSGAEITVDPLPTVTGDGRRLSLLVENLLSNAIRYSREGEAPVISVAAAPEGDDWHFRVADRGRGIAPRDQERVFHLFERADGAAGPGAGIGLAVCRKVVEEHGGRIWVESRASDGTTVHFTLAGV
jgi:signal transduction histidine kinase